EGVHPVATPLLDRFRRRGTPGVHPGPALGPDRVTVGEVPVVEGDGAAVGHPDPVEVDTAPGVEGVGGVAQPQLDVAAAVAEVEAALPPAAQPVPGDAA